MTIKLFEFNHPKHGYYSVWYDREMKTYGITKKRDGSLVCLCEYCRIV